MRPTHLFALALPLALGCEGTTTQTPDGRAPDAVVDVASERPDDVADAARDARDDLADATDAPDAMTPCTLDIPPPDTAGPTYGYIRFANLARGVGTMRFVADSLPGFSPAHVEAVVPEGTSTEHIRTLPVAYEVHVSAAPGADAGYSADAGAGDAGVLTDGPGSPATLCTADAGAGDLVPPICTDVYFIAGCTIVLAGSREGDVAQQRDRRLWRLSDVPARSNDCYAGRVRTLSWYAEGPALDVDGPDGPLARNAAYHETTGYRGAAAGPLRVTVRNNETGDPLGEHAAGVVAPGHSHTLHVWGDARNAASPGVSAILLDDVTPPFR